MQHCIALPHRIVILTDMRWQKSAPPEAFSDKLFAQLEVVPQKLTLWVEL